MATSLTFTTSLVGIAAPDLADSFFEGWAAPPSAEEHLALLRRATHVALAVDDGRVVGFATALSDGVLSAYLPLVEVRPSHRRRGIGTRLVQLLLDRIGELYMVDVICDDDVLPFYEALGFERAGGAVRRNYGWRARP